MKIRRALTVAVATAAIAPAALLAAPAAYATDPTPSVSATESAAVDETPGTSPSPSATESADSAKPADETETEPETGPSTSESSTATTPSTPTSPSKTAPAPSTSAPEKTPDPEPSQCEDSKVDVAISGLPGKITADGKWHEFSLTMGNNSDSVLQEIDFLAGASADADGAELFKKKEILLEAWDPDAEVWDRLDDDGEALGYVGFADELEPGYEVEISMRIMVTKSAPVGAGFSFGASIYGDTDGECLGLGYASYRFQIVASGTDTGGTKPQEGGKAPVTDAKPSGNTPKVTGSLAETGSSSALPMIGLLGGATVVAGAGAVFLVRRRKTGVEA
ncbi:hypothetical protein SHKM778_10170 [Streptomyces sp. KM77-8]|uniref:Gram-positive cocci surface proteins LPxTG domain-containing protein n=1 Tax=Streptomyces haneummycinicus TaxID=3074435 RepID=A0AAT9HB62_9ACTN